MVRKEDLLKINDWLWEIPKSFRKDMRVPARIYASEHMLEDILQDKTLTQLVNVATLPEIQKYALAMPDAHEGYGCPVGGVFATDAKEGIISPGAVGYDILCGVRLLGSDKTFSEVGPYLEKLGGEIYREVPSGVGRGGRLNLKNKELSAVLVGGAKRMVEIGYGDSEDLGHIESGGVLDDADPELVSDHAKARGRDQLGTMGAGNHFVEVQAVKTIFDEAEAKRLGLFKDQVVVMIHTGSRGLGHQIATDYIRVMIKALPKYNIVLPDRELACAPFKSYEGQNYFKAMSAGANFAWANRQLITWEVRQAFKRILGDGDLGVVYDVAHNIAKVERYNPNLRMPANATNEKKMDLVVHRKGATRAFPGQPVLIPGSMGTASYVLVGEAKAMEETFGSSCHGAGRRMSRTQAKKEIQGSKLKQKLNEEGIVVNTGSLSGLAEEAPQAYKDVDEVVEVVHRADIAKKVARLKPLAVIKR